jgi:hypothetical protein
MFEYSCRLDSDAGEITNVASFKYMGTTQNKIAFLLTLRAD